jgi:hypothetical protein
MEVSKINSKHIKQYQNLLAQRGASEATIKRNLSSLRKFSGWLTSQGYLNKDPLATRKKWFPQLLYRPRMAFQAQRALPYFTYLNFIILAVFLTALGWGLYQQFVVRAPSPLAYPEEGVGPKRYLSFQGRLTDSGYTPITTIVTTRFYLYDAAGTGHPPTGGTLLWDSGDCSLDPDQDGIFAILLGTTSGDGYTCPSALEIPSSVFSENAEVWLHIKVGSEDLDPRIQIATVAYALNAETLQGFPLASAGNPTPEATMGATARTVPAINPAGNLVIASDSPTIWSTSGTFGIKGQAITIQTDTGTGGNITLAPDGTGVINIVPTSGNQIGGTVNATNSALTTGALYTGRVENENTGFDFLRFFGGVSPTERFSVGALGNIYTANNLDVAGAATITGTLATNGAIISNLIPSGTRNLGSSGSNWDYLYVNNIDAFTLQGAVTGNGQNITNLGQLTVDNLRLDGNTLDSTSGNLTLLSAGELYFDDTRTGAIPFSASDTTLNAALTQAIVDAINETYDAATGVGGISGFWTKTTGLLFPNNTYESVAVGGTATSSAKLYFEGTTGNASMSGQLTLHATGTNYINALSGQALSLRTSVGGDAGLTDRLYITNSGYVGIGTTNPSKILDVSAPLVWGKFTSSTGTNYGLLSVTNTGGNLYLGLDSSTGGGLITGSIAYSAVIAHTGNYPMHLGTNGAIRMTISNAGNVGIGTTDPSAKLDIVGDLEVNGYATVSSSLAVGYSNAPAGPGNAVFQGNVGIGTTNPGYSLEVSGGNAQFDGIVYFANGTTYYVDASGHASLNNITGAGTLDINGGGTHDIAGTLNLSGNALTSTGDLTITPGGGNVLLAGNFLPSSGDTYDLGSTTAYWNNLYVNNIFGSSGGTQGHWSKSNGLIYPNNTYESVAVGGTSTTSATLYFEGTTGNASMSGNLTFRGGGTIGATDMNNLTIGDVSTNNIQFYSGSYYLNPSGQLTLATEETINGIDISAGAIADLTGLTFDGSARTITNANQLTLSTSGASSDLVLSAGRDITFDDDNLSSPVPLSVSASGLNVALTQGIIDAINEAYDAAVGSGGISGFWTKTLGLLFPNNAYESVAIGGTATSSAKLYFEGTTGNASMSGNLALAGGGTIGATDMNNLTLGDSNTQNIIINPSGNVGIGTTSPGERLTIGGNNIGDAISVHPTSDIPADKTYVYDDSTWSENEENILTSSDGRFYIGYSEPFSGVHLDLGTSATYDGTGETGWYWSYYSTSGWSYSIRPFDYTENFTQDGVFVFNPPSDWTTTTLSPDDTPRYWVFVSSISGYSYLTQNPILDTLPNSAKIIRGKAFSVYTTSAESLPIFQIDRNGDVAIGGSLPDDVHARLYINNSIEGTSLGAGGDALAGIYQDIDFGGRYVENTYGYYNKVTGGGLDTDLTVMYNEFNDTQTNTTYWNGIFNYLDFDAGSSSWFYGFRNELHTDGAQTYGLRNDLYSTSDAKTSTLYGVRNILETHDTDIAYGSRTTDSSDSTGGTQYGVYVDLDDPQVTNYSLYVESGSGISYFGSNVGIGTTNPGAKLTVLDGDIVLREDDDGNDAVKITAGTGRGWIEILEAGGIKTKLTAQDSYFIGDNVGIGTTNPSAKLDIVGNATISGTLALGPQTEAYAGNCDASAEGKMYYDGSANKYYYCNGSSWTEMGGGAAGLWEDGTYGVYENDKAVIVGEDTAFSWADSGVGDLKVEDQLEVGGDASISGTLTIGQGETIRPAYGPLQFAYKSGADAWTTGMVINENGSVGIEGSLYDISQAALTIDDSLTLTGNTLTFGQGETIDNTTNGRLTFTGNTFVTGIAYFANNTTYYVDASGHANLNNITGAGTLDINGAGTHDIAGTLNLSGNALTSTGDLTITPGGGNVLSAGNILPNTGDTYDLGSTTAYWNNLYVNNVFGSSGGTQGFWTKTTGLIYPNNNYESIAIGGTATSSAKLYFEGTTGNASMSGQLTLHNSGTNYINTLNGQAISLRTSVGGDTDLTDRLYIANSGNVGIGITEPGAKLHLSGTGSDKILLKTTETATGKTDHKASPSIDLTSNIWVYPGSVATDKTITIQNEGVNNVDSAYVLSFSSTDVDPLFSVRGDTGTFGIGTNQPAQKFHIYSTSAGALSYAIQMQNASSDTNTGTGILFSTEGSTQYGKGGIAYIRTTSYARGDLYFLQDSAADVGNAALSDSAMVIKNSGNVGIGTTAPVGKLEVSGTNTGKALAIFNESGTVNDIFTASASGTPKFTISNAGNITTTGTASFNSGGVQIEADSDVVAARFVDSVGSQAYFLDPAATSISLTVAGSIGIGTTAPSAKLDIVGDLEVNGYATVSGSLAVGYAGGIAGPGNAIFQGKVGIGTTSPTAELDVSGTASVSALTNRGASPGYINQLNGNDLIFRTSPGGDAGLTDRMTITNAGNVGIGTTDPTTLLDVHGNLTVDPAGGVGASTIPLLVRSSTSDANYAMGVNNSNGDNLFWVQSDGKIGLGESSPDATLEIVESGTTPLMISNGASGDGDFLIVTTSGNVGIGTTNPLYALDVNGYIQVGTDDKIGASGFDSASGYFVPYDSSGRTLIWNTYASSQGILFGTNDTEQMIITNAGYVGIGTTDPASTLHIQGTSQTVANFDTTGSRAGQIQVDGGTTGAGSGGGILFGAYDDVFASIRGYILDAGNYGIGDLIIGTRNATTDTSLTERMRIAYGGNVGIGTTNPSAKLDVAGDASVSGNLYLNANGEIRPMTNGSLSLDYKSGVNAWTQALTVNNLGYVGIGTTAPDAVLHVVGNPKISSSADITDYTNISNDSTWTTFTRATNGGTTGNAMQFNSAGTVYFPGYVGIGTTGPRGSLDVLSGISYFGDESSAVGNIVRFGKNSLTAGATMVGWGTDDTGAAGRYFVQMRSNTSGTYDVEFSVSTQGNLLSDLAATTPADFAEYFYTNDPGLSKGTLVSLDEANPRQPMGTVEKTTLGNKHSIVGVISTKPGFVGALGDDVTDNFVTYENDSHYKIVGLLGQVPVIVSSVNGQINQGDPITASLIPGVGGLAEKEGLIVGRTIEGTNHWNETSCSLVDGPESITWPEDENGTNLDKPCFRLSDGTYVGKIMVLVHLSWYDPDVYLTDSGELQISTNTTNPPDGEAGKYQLTKGNTVIDRVGAFGQAIIANLRTGLIQTQELIADSLTVNQEIISPVVETGQLTANKVTSDQLSVKSLEAEESKFGKLLVQNEQGETVASIDNSGNASFGGLLEATAVTSDQLSVTGDATVGGTLYAQEIVTEKGTFGDLLARVESLENQKTQSVSEPENQTPSENQTAGNSDLSDTLASSDLSETPSSSESSDLAESSESWILSDPSDDILLTLDIMITGNLTALGTTSLADTSVAGQLMVDATIIIDKDGIQTLPGSTLKLQAYGWGGIDMLGGKVVIDTDGNVLITGELTAGRINTGGLILNESLASDEEATASGFGKLLAVINREGKEVASIDASGSAFFAQLGIEADYTATQSGAIIAAAQNYYENGYLAPAIKTNATAGIGILPAYESEVMIYNPQVTGESLVYVTATTNTENKVLYVKAKKATISPTEPGWFIIALNESIAQDVQFNWWIIGGKN